MNRLIPNPDYITAPLREIHYSYPDQFTIMTATNREYIADQDNRTITAAWINDVVSLCHGLAAEAGWWEDDRLGDHRVVVNDPDGPLAKFIGKALVAQKLCLIHSEVSEAMEGFRKNLMDDKLPHRTMLEVELADAAIRIFDLAGALNLDLGGAIVEKLSFNAVREDHTAEHRAGENGKAF